MSDMICGARLGLMGLTCSRPAGHAGDHQVQVDSQGNPVKSVQVNASVAKSFVNSFNRQNIFLFDPDQPKEDPNELLNRVHHGKMLDPREMNHNCPFCNKTMAWDLFLAHAEDCFKRWRKVVYRSKRKIGTVTR